MSSPLESIPYDVLLHIAFLLASEGLLDCLSALRNLLLTSRTMYTDLNVRGNPFLYARLFHHQFDSPTSTSASAERTSTSLALEYIARRNLLRRSRSHTWDEGHLLSDMRCAFRMSIEGNGANEQQLAMAGFPGQLLNLTEAYLPLGDGAGTHLRELKAILVWLLSLSISRDVISNVSPARLENLCLLLHRFAVPLPNNNTVPAVWYSGLISAPAHPRRDFIASSQLQGHNGERQAQLGQGARRQLGVAELSPRCTHPLATLQPCFAAINLIFAMKETCPLSIPPHLPDTRAIALANQVTGPTRQDLREFESCKTPLFADGLASLLTVGPSPPSSQSASETPRATTTLRPASRRSESHDRELHQLFGSAPPGSEHALAGSHNPYAPGAFSGLWSGSMMTEGCMPQQDGGEERPDFNNRQPLQVMLRSYHRYSDTPHTPVPSNDVSSGEERPFDVFPFQPALPVNDFERSLEQSHHVKWMSNGAAVGPDKATSPKATRSAEVVDTVFVGETTEEFDQAWKGFTYIGCIQRGGLVLLQRKPKNQAEEYLGITLFEGRLRNGQTFVGRWRNSIEEQGPRGIFSLVKATESG